MIRHALRSGIAIALLAAAGSAGISAQDGAGYLAELEEWRGDRVERLRSETGWLTLVGLHWLEPGENRFGADPDLPILLSAEGLPGWAGTFHLDDDGVRVESASGSSLSINDDPVSGIVAVRDDNQEERDELALGRLRLYVIKRGDRYGIRVKDPESLVRLNFSGIEYFDIDPALHFEAEFHPFDEPREVEIPTAVGTTASLLAPGEVVFEVDGVTHRLLPLVGDPEETEFWFIFSDKTSGKQTYGFRYLYGDLGENGRVALDFNYAYNPPCAFTPYATCALPPKQNRLTTRIEAGEMIYGH